MIELTKVIIEGFCSIPFLDMPLNTNHTILIKGPNGNGKTSFISAIVWGLYGKTLKGIPDVNTWKKYRPKDYLGTKVEVFFKSKGKVHKVIRCQEYREKVNGSKGGNRLIYMIDAEQVEEKSKIKIQSLIEENMGMSYNLFINSIVFGQGMKRLIQESGADKKSLFEEIFQLDYLSKARKIAQEKYNELDTCYQDYKYKCESIISKLDGFKEMKTEYKQLIKNQDKQHQGEINELKKQKILSTKAINDLVLRCKDIKYKSIKTQYSETTKDIQEYRNKLSKLKEETGIPLQEFVDKLIKLMKAKKYTESLEMVEDIKNKYGAIEKYKELIMSSNEKKESLYKNILLYDNIQDKIELNKREIDRIEEKINKLTSSNQSKDIKKSLERVKNQIRIEQEKLESTNKLLKVSQKNRELYKWAYTDPLGNNGIKAFLFESSLSYLNETLSSYSEVLGFNIQFTVDLNSTKKDFVTLISMDGIDVFYEELSGGQKQLVNLAMAFAMNEVIANSKNINIAFLDEVFESLSADNIDIVIGLIRKVYKNRTLFLISHQDSLPIPNAKVLIVNREHGLSTYSFK